MLCHTIRTSPSPARLRVEAQPPFRSSEPDPPGDRPGAEETLRVLLLVRGGLELEAVVGVGVESGPPGDGPRVEEALLPVGVEVVVVFRRERHGLEGREEKVACDLRLREVEVDARGRRSRRGRRGREGRLCGSVEDGVIWEKREFSEDSREGELGGIRELGGVGGREQRTAPRIVGKHVGGRHGGQAGCKGRHGDEVVGCAAVGSGRTG